jgi:opine dehydrogenase
MAGHLSLMGFPVRLYDIIPETVDAVRRKGGIQLDGLVKGFGKLEVATLNVAEAIEGADIIAVVTPAVAHREVAKACAPHLAHGQVVYIHPGATGGALEFRKVLEDKKCNARIGIAEANSLIYACRSPEPAHASILGIKSDLLVAALPATETRWVVEMLNNTFPQIRPAKNVLETGLGNPNAMMHPAPTLLNASMIESGRDWLYYWDGITPSIGAFVEAIDQERLSVAKAFGLDLPSIREWYGLAYGARGNSLTEVVRNNKAYAGVKGQKTLLTRYLLEDIPTGLVPMASLGRVLGVDVTRMETVVRLGEFLTGKTFFAEGRTVDALGLSGMTSEQIVAFVETGTR